MRDCFDAGLDATAFPRLWANQSRVLLDGARAGWTATQHNSGRLHLGRMQQPHARATLCRRCQCTHGCRCRCRCRPWRRGRHTPASFCYAQVLKHDLFDPTNAYFEKTLGLAGRSDNNGALATSSRGRRGSSAVSLSLAGRMCSPRLALGVLGLTFDFQITAQIPFQDAIASSYVDGLGAVHHVGSSVSRHSSGRGLQYLVQTCSLQDCLSTASACKVQLACTLYVWHVR